MVHKCLTIPVDDMIIHTGNGGTNVNFWIVILFCIQQVAIQMQLLAWILWKKMILISLEAGKTTLEECYV